MDDDFWKIKSGEINVEVSDEPYKYAKPAAYWFVNCKPTTGFTYQKNKKVKKILSSKKSAKAGVCSEERSMISSDYARNFIRDQILGLSQPEYSLQLSMFRE
jgi:hypothetical protein